MTDVSEQRRLDLPRKPVEVPIQAVRRQASMTRAIVLCAELGGLVNDKDQARVLDIDPTTWSLIKAGQRAFPHEKYEQMFNEFGNDAPLIWLADRRGFTLVPKETELERRLRLTEEELKREREMRTYAESLLTRSGRV